MLGNKKDRDEQMENLDKFAETAWQRLTGVLSNFGWTTQSMTEVILAVPLFPRPTYAARLHGNKFLARLISEPAVVRLSVQRRALDAGKEFRRSFGKVRMESRRLHGGRAALVRAVSIPERLVCS